LIGGGSSDSSSQQGTGDDSNYSDGNIYNHLYSLRFAGILLAVIINILSLLCFSQQQRRLASHKIKTKKIIPLKIFLIEIS
jgi:hypothetical protein